MSIHDPSLNLAGQLSFKLDLDTDNSIVPVTREAPDTLSESLGFTLVVGLFVSNNGHLLGNSDGRSLLGPGIRERTTTTNLEETASSVEFVVEPGALRPVLNSYTLGLVSAEPVVSESVASSDVDPVTSVVSIFVESEEM